MGVQPKLVACPDWIIGDDTGERGKGMMAQYGVVIEDAKMRPCDYQVIEGKWRPLPGIIPLILRSIIGRWIYRHPSQQPLKV